MAPRRVIRGGALLPLDGRSGLRRTDVLLADGRIAAIGGVAAGDAEVVEVRGVIMPGLVQAHVHLDLALQDRGFVPAQDPRIHLRQQRPAWREGFDEAAARTSAQAGLAWTLAAGATVVADASSARFAMSVVSAARTVGSRVVLFVDAGARDAREALVILRETVDSLDMSPWVSLALWAGEGERASKATLRHAAKLSRDEDLPLFVSVGLLPGDRGAVERLDRLGALGPQLVLTHGHGRSLGGNRMLARIARAGAKVVVTPSYEVLTGAPAAPVLGLLEAGVPVGLGSEGGAARLGLDVFAEARLALRGLEGRVPAPATAALEMATRHGAAALGIEAGSLEVGRAADVLLIGIEAEPHDDQESMARRVIESAGPEHIRQIWVAGAERVGERGARRVPAEDVLDAVRAGRRGADLDATEGWAAVTEVIRRQVRRWQGWHPTSWP